MSREIKIGFFFLVVFSAAIWGFVYLKGKNLLSKSYTYKTYYDDVSQLTKSSPILINGFKVGSIYNISLAPEDPKKILVEFEVEKDYGIPKDAVALLISNGPVAGKAINIRFDKRCSGDNCARSGDVLQGKTLGLIQSMVGVDEVKQYTSAISEDLKSVIESIGSENGKGALNNSIRELEKTLTNLTSLSKNANELIMRSSNGIRQSLQNMNTITDNIAANNQKITSILQNFEYISSQLKDANIGHTITASTSTIEESKQVISSLKNTVKNLNKSLEGLDVVLSKVNSGNGTLAKLINENELYDNLESTSRHLALLLQDLRLNPSRYVKVSVFGKKNNKAYVKPEDDPALKN